MTIWFLIGSTATGQTLYQDQCILQAWSRLLAAALVQVHSVCFTFVSPARSEIRYLLWYNLCAPPSSAWIINIFLQKKKKKLPCTLKLSWHEKPFELHIYRCLHILLYQSHHSCSAARSVWSLHVISHICLPVDGRWGCLFLKQRQSAGSAFSRYPPLRASVV